MYIIYVFQGCFWHGCPKCYTNRDIFVPGTGLTMDDVYNRTLNRQSFVENQGITMRVKWECELKRELKENPEMMDYFDNIKLTEPMGGREAFHGNKM